MSFATAGDVAVRLGRGPLTSGQTAQATALLEQAAGAIADAVGKDAAWAAALNPVPPVVRGVCIEAVVRVMLNPGGVRSQSAQLGAFQHAESFRDGMGALELTDSEERRVRRAVFGAGSGSVRVGGLIDDVLENRLLGDKYLPAVTTWEEGDE